MGNFFSKSVLDEDWREFSWKGEENLNYVKKFKPHKSIHQLRVLMYGPVAAGKSSFITSVISAMEGRLVPGALANSNTNDESFTTMYKAHKIRKDDDNFYPFVLCDTMGIKPVDKKGVCASDIKLILEGHMKEKYKYNPLSPLSKESPFYNANPGPEDKVHVLVFVINGNSLQIPKSILENMALVRQEAKDLGIPQVAVVTHIDEACKQTDKDLRNVYKSKFLKTQMTEISSGTGIPLNCILPVKNYSKDNELQPNMNALILSAMKQILEFGNDFVSKMEN